MASTSSRIERLRETWQETVIDLGFETEEQLGAWIHVNVRIPAWVRQWAVELVQCRALDPRFRREADRHIVSIDEWR